MGLEELLAETSKFISSECCALAARPELCGRHLHHVTSSRRAASTVTNCPIPELPPKKRMGLISKNWKTFKDPRSQWHCHSRMPLREFTRVRSASAKLLKFKKIAAASTTTTSADCTARGPAGRRGIRVQPGVVCAHSGERVTSQETFILAMLLSLRRILRTVLV
jgi:hypothetical protein